MGLNENGWPKIDRLSENNQIDDGDYSEGYSDGHDQGIKDATFDMNDHLKIKLQFAIEKIKEAKERGLSLSELQTELESDYCTYL